MYASKRRQRNFKRVRDTPKVCTATNPSKRHRERLNGELETVAQLLPYDGNTVSRLDKLSVLRLAVSYLQVKAHFNACLHSSTFLSQLPLLFTHAYSYRPPQIRYTNEVPTLCDLRTGIPLIDREERFFESIAMKALGGFLLVLNDNGEIYYASENVEEYLGFHQSDILHQPLYELIHSEDREDIRQQLDPNFNLPPSCASVEDLLNTDNLHCLERNANARFRCLLDNTCGFLRIDLHGKLLSLHGLPSSYVAGRSQAGAVIGMVALCTPFVPPNTSDLLAEDLILKTKHQLDGTVVSMDQKVHDMLEVTENDLPLSLYQLAHPQDALCLAEAHKEVLKNGSSGLLIYRLISTKSSRMYYIQSSCRMFYKNGKPDAIGLTHRLLNEVEGTMLLEKRSSLKAKLLSFDDSLLQSPRNLQSAAALPVPLRDEVLESMQGFPSTSTSASSVGRKRKSRQLSEEQLHLQQQQNVVEQQPIPRVFEGIPSIWGQLPQGIISDLPLGACLPDPSGALRWPSADWTEMYAQAPYPTHVNVHHPIVPSMPSMHEFPIVDYHQWQPSTSHALPQVPVPPAILPELASLDEIAAKNYHYQEYQKQPDYPLPPFAAPSSGFHLISEVTHTLLGQ